MPSISRVFSVIVVLLLENFFDRLFLLDNFSFILRVFRHLQVFPRIASRGNFPATSDRGMNELQNYLYDATVTQSL